eukprot:scaffold31550_cov39-Isochrysis_galbana.AAC.1
MRVETSTSKAHNLNAAMQLVDTENVVIYDADHHPDPGSLMTLTSFMQVNGCVRTGLPGGSRHGSML